jgi:hypothetical protein
LKLIIRTLNVNDVNVVKSNKVGEKVKARKKQAGKRTCRSIYI